MEAPKALTTEVLLGSVKDLPVLVLPSTEMGILRSMRWLRRRLTGLLGRVVIKLI
jgi:hypothetical protein